MRFPRFIGKLVRARRVALPLVGVAALAIAGCGSSSSSSTGSSASSGSGSSVKVALILKTFSNPYFVAMEKQAKEDAAKLGVTLDVSAGTTDGDTVVWGTNDDGDTVVWGTSCTDPSCQPVIWNQ